MAMLEDLEKTLSLRVDARARAFLGGVDAQKLPVKELILYTPRGLGLTQHPIHAEVLAAARSKAGQIALVSPEEFLGLVPFLMHPQGGVYTAGSEGSTVLQLVVKGGESWLYAVDISEHRWPLGQPFVFRQGGVASEQSQPPESCEQPAPEDLLLADDKLVVYPDETPGANCGQMALRMVLGDVTLPRGWRRDLVTRTPLGWLAYKLGRPFLPWQMPPVLARYGVRAQLEWWGIRSFERKLEDTLGAGHMAVLLLYARRRLHGQHYVVVAGGERYRGVRYWHVADAQFGLREYGGLLKGNALLSTEELLRSFPNYLFGMGPIGIFAVVIFGRQ